MEACRYIYCPTRCCEKIGHWSDFNISFPPLILSYFTMSQALAAEGSMSEVYILNCIILTISIASAVGAAWMIMSFCVSYPSVQVVHSKLPIVSTC